MLKTNFDELEHSLTVVLEQVKRNQIHELTQKDNQNSLQNGALMLQLEEQTRILNLLRDNYQELKAHTDWKKIEGPSHNLLTHHQLFNEEQVASFDQLKRNIQKMVSTIRGVIDRELNNKIIERGQSQAKRSTLVKTFKNWTPI